MSLRASQSLKAGLSGIAPDLPSSCSITMTSIAPLNVAGLMEFHVFDTEPLILRTYCISQAQRSGKFWALRAEEGATPVTAARLVHRDRRQVVSDRYK